MRTSWFRNPERRCPGNDELIGKTGSETPIGNERRRAPTQALELLRKIAEQGALEVGKRANGVAPVSDAVEEQTELAAQPRGGPGQKRPQ